jgi:cytochrome c553
MPLRCLLLLGWVTAVAAQPTVLKPAPGEDLRPLFANSADVAEGKRVAEATCARCHGPNGISVTRGVPHIAGQRAGYLHLQLKAYQKGARPDTAMAGAVRFLRDDALVAVAAYYASLEPPRPANLKAPADTDPVSAGKAAASACSGCHGESGVTSMPGTPNLAALDPKSFANAIAAYKSGDRKSDVMKPFAGGLNETTTANIAIFYALQKPDKAATSASGDTAAGKQAAAACAGCHGETGVSAIPGTPSLAGQDAQYIVAALQAYRDGGRKDETMRGPVAALDARAAKDVAAFFAAQAPQTPEVRRPLSLSQWIERCERCHGRNGNSIEPSIPALAAQRADWLEAALDAYRKGERKSSTMAAMAALLTENDIRALSAHYARQTARPAVYVLLPGEKR